MSQKFYKVSLEKYNTFIIFMISHILKHPKKLEKIVEIAFKAMDTNDNGVIESDELESVMINMADDLGMEQPSKEEVKEMIRDLNQNNI